MLKIKAKFRTAKSQEPDTMLFAAGCLSDKARRRQRQISGWQIQVRRGRALTVVVVDAAY